MQLRRGDRLPEVASTAHEFLCERQMTKYATMVLARLHAGGDVEIINCGNVEPVMVARDGVRNVVGGCVPVGLMPISDFPVCRAHLDIGDRLLLVTDGFTDARNGAGQFYGAERLHQVARDGLDALFASVAEFREGTSPEDDCTAVEIIRKR